jgi:hypothetical protein
MKCFFPVGGVCKDGDVVQCIQLLGATIYLFPRIHPKRTNF